MEEQKYKNLKSGERGAIISIAAYLILSVIKLVTGYISDSAALRADGFNNITDIVASLAVLIGLMLSRRPPDKDHGYGHWKSETIASMIASFIMMAVGLQVLLDSINSLFWETREPPDILAAYVSVFSAAALYAVYRYNKKLANKINSKAVMANAKNNMADAWVSIGAAAGIFGSQFNMPWLDAVAAFFVGLLICKAAWDIFKEASHELSDGFDEQKIRLYQDVIINLDGVKGIKEIKGRNYGNNEVIDVVILVNSVLGVKEAHDIATRVEEVMINDYDVYDVHVHVEPD